MESVLRDTREGSAYSRVSKERLPGRMPGVFVFKFLNDDKIWQLSKWAAISGIYGTAKRLVDDLVHG